MALSGLLPASQLSTIMGTTRTIRFDLVAQTNALRWAFEAHFGKPLVVTDGYRSYQSQVDVFTARYTQAYLVGRPFRTWNGSRWYQKPGTAVAAVPGTSNHGWAQALDLGSGVNSSLTSAEYLWMRANAGRFGFSHPLWARQAGTLEPWHWEAVYVPPSSYASSGGGGGGTPTPIPPTPIPEVPDMDAQDKAIAQATLDAANASNQNASAANQNAAAANQQAHEANLNAAAASRYAQGGWELSQQLLALLKQQGQISARQFNELSAQIDDVKARAALATRKQYTGLVAETTSYSSLASKYATYEDMAGVRDPLKANVTVDAQIPAGQIEEEVKDALVAAAPALADAVADENYRRMKE